MKKTMFITSVIMVVVMAIALTTSSLAWFTAGGQDNVTTTAFKVTATGGTADGISISKDQAQWASNIPLASSGFSYSGTVQEHDNAGLNPLVPFANLAADSIDEDALVACLSGGTVSSTFCPALMIGNKIDANGKFTDDAYTDGYYVDQFYIRNEASGSTATSIVLSAPTISFSFDKDVIVSGNTEQVDTAYTSANRGAERYALDAVLCVAVLAATNEFDDTPDNEGWEIIGYADSKGNTTINIGKLAADFAETKTASASYLAFPVAVTTGDESGRYNLNKASTEEMRPVREDNGSTSPADIKTVKVVAWYDGAIMNNNNSASANLKFAVNFGYQAYVAPNP